MLILMYQIMMEGPLFIGMLKILFYHFIFCFVHENLDFKLLMENIRAAYKGFADTIRLLLFWDAFQGKQDKEGIYL